jgi:ATP-binding cassette subfamily C protein
MWRKIFVVYWNAPGGKPISSAVLMLLAGLADMFSMGALVPLMGQMTSDDGQKNSPLARVVVDGFAWMGIAPTFINLLLFVGTALILKSLISLGALTFVGISVADVTTYIRTRLLGALVRANWAYFVDHKPGEVAAQISAQSAQAGQAYYQAAQHITTVISGLGLFTAAALISSKMMVFAVVAMALLIGPLAYILRLADRSSRSQWEAANDLTTGLEDVVNNMKPLKSMGREGPYIKNFNSNIRTLRTALIQMVVSRHSTFYGQDILAVIMVVGGVYIGVNLLNTPLSQFLAFGIVFYQMVDVVKRIQQTLQEAVFASAGYFGVMDTIAKGEQHAEFQGGAAMPEFTDALRFEDVSFAYGTKTVLSHVTATIPAREISVLVGPSGSGKTTFLDLIIGFNRPSRGRITVDGIDLNDINLQSWRRIIGYVPQELTLLRGSIADNITLGDTALTEGDVREALRLAGALDFVTALPDGMDTDIGTMGARLSGGQRQRISLARALVHKPKFLLLDEVTSALDEQTEMGIVQNIRELSGQLTILAITHRSAWLGIAAKIYRIAQGKAQEEALPRPAKAPAARKGQAKSSPMPIGGRQRSR